MSKFKKILLVRDQVLVTVKEKHPTYFSKLMELILLQETIYPLKTVKIISTETILRNNTQITRVRYCHKQQLHYNFVVN